MFIVALSLPVYSGHVQVGGGAYCGCGTPGCVEDYPGECSGGGNGATQQDKTPGDVSDELGIVIVALLLWLRLKA
jgi:predicted NBD/HSP70 family sugar kinase